MNKEDKNRVIDDLKSQLASNANFYLADTSALSAEKTSALRRMCFDRKIKMIVVKNTLLEKAMEASEGKDYSPLFPALKGNTAVMFSQSGSEPAKLIKEFRQKNDKPVLKGAFVEETVYLGDAQLEFLSAIKSKNELIGDIIGLLQSPAKNVISALSSGKHKLAGVVKTLSERPE
ncbi:MAG: 50S ribosomal protein L10 [Bacteroidia bacterium]|nr:50S ribosomal protein L10 [Bacteroidia bacterium]